MNLAPKKTIYSASLFHRLPDARIFSNIPLLAPSYSTTYQRSKITMSSLHTSINPLRRFTANLLGLASLSMDCAPALKLEAVKEAEAYNPSTLRALGLDAPLGLARLGRPDPNRPMTINPRSLSRTPFTCSSQGNSSVRHGDLIAVTDVTESEGLGQPEPAYIRRIMCFTRNPPLDGTEWQFNWVALCL